MGVLEKEYGDCSFCMGSKGNGEINGCEGVGSRGGWECEFSMRHRV